MGNGYFYQLCCCNSYCDEGDYDVINSFRLNGSSNIENIYPDDNIILQLSIRDFDISNDMNNYDLINNSENLNNDSNVNNISQLNSIILENIDKLCPEKKRCIICLENFERFDKVINLSCLHMFHNNCIKTWLESKNYCPICKNKI